MTYPTSFGTPPDQQILGAQTIPVYPNAASLALEKGLFPNGAMVAVQSPSPVFYMAQLAPPTAGIAFILSVSPQSYGNQNIYWVPSSGVFTLSTPFNLAAIQALTSGTHTAVGAVLPAGSLLVGAQIVVATPVTGGTLTAVSATVQGGADAAGTILGATDVFTAAGTFSTPGSNPYPVRGGQQIYLTLTSTGDTLAHATAGSLFVNLIIANAA